MAGVQVTRARVRLWAAVLVLAWLPGVTFFGHWGDLAMPLVGEAGSSFVSHAHGDHSDHCHGGFSDCGSQGGAGELTPATALLSVDGTAPPSVFRGSTHTRTTAPQSETVAPIAPPPRAA